MTTTTDTFTVSDRDFDPIVTLNQIGRRDVLATSGGRYRVDHGGAHAPQALELPVSSGYSVRIALAANDTYTVQRIMRRGQKCWVKGTVTDVHAEDLGEIVYVAGCYKNRDFGAHRVEG